jgi:hypothetical protein
MVAAIGIELKDIWVIMTKSDGKNKKSIIDQPGK